MADEPRPSSGDKPGRGIAGRVFGAVVGPLVPPVVDIVDVDGVLRRIDVDELLGRVDVDELLQRIDLNALLERVDLNALVERIDIDRIAQRVDPDALVDRVDVNRVLERVDTEALVERTELGALIARSTGGALTDLLDAVRSYCASLDLLLHGSVNRLLRRGSEVAPMLDSPAVVDPAHAAGTRVRNVALQRGSAGLVTRVLAFAIDMVIASVLFQVGLVLLSLILEVAIGEPWMTRDHRLAAALAFWVWAFVYFAASTATVGRTFGMTLLGLKVVRADGREIHPLHAALRTLVLPLSFLLFGLGLLLGVLRPDRRTLHDLIAGTTVVYAWDARTARLRLLASGATSDRRFFTQTPR